MWRRRVEKGVCLYGLIRAYTGLSFADMAVALGITIETLKHRRLYGSPLTHIEMLNIMERTGMDWPEIGYLIELSAQGTDNTSDLLHENSKTRAVRRRRGGEGGS